MYSTVVGSLCVGYQVSWVGSEVNQARFHAAPSRRGHNAMLYPPAYHAVTGFLSGSLSTYRIQI